MNPFEKINSIIGKANETTGNGDTDLTSAVSSLISGFGGSGGLPDFITKVGQAKATSSNDMSFEMGTDVKFVLIYTPDVVVNKLQIVFVPIGEYLNITNVAYKSYAGTAFSLANYTRVIANYGTGSVLTIKQASSYMYSFDTSATYYYICFS